MKREIELLEKLEWKLKFMHAASQNNPSCSDSGKILEMIALVQQIRSLVLRD